MSKHKVVIAFPNFRSLWMFARKIETVNIEVNRNHAILTCDCSEKELSFLSQLGGRLIECENSHHSLPPESREGNASLRSLGQ